jgi:ATP-dependent Clp protease protease subunit
MKTKQKEKEFAEFATKHLGISSLKLDYFSKATIKNGNILSPVGMTPNVMEERQMNVVQLDVFSRLMMDRIIFLGLPIDEMIANIVNAQLLFLESVDKAEPIKIYINSPGGSVYDGLGIYDCMQYVSPKISTVNTGKAASMAFVLMIAGEKGHRASLPHARFMQHQPLGGAYGQASDIEITAREIGKLKKELYDIISLHTGQKFDKIEKDCDRDYWMTASEAEKYGCVDNILIRTKAKK